MLDARNIGQLMKGSRKVYEFTPEQLQNIAAIVWLYRGQKKRFQALLTLYREKCREHRRALAAVLPPLGDAVEALGTALKGCAVALSPEFTTALDAARTEISSLDRQIGKRDYAKDAAALPELAAASKAIGRLALQIRRATGPLVTAALEGDASKESRKTLKTKQQECDAAWQAAVEAAHRNNYFTHQLEWLLHRFPDAEFQAIPGLCKVVTRAEIEAADWSLTPGRYVGVAPVAVDEDFDFEQTITDIHTELATLNKDAAGLAKTIQKNFEALGV